MPMLRRRSLMMARSAAASRRFFSLCSISIGMDALSCWSEEGMVVALGGGGGGSRSSPRSWAYR